MMQQWRDYLSARDSSPDGEPRANGTEDDCRCWDLSHLGLVSASGPDAEGFLQGQLTNDVRQLTQCHSQLSSHCQQKGRILGLFRMIRIGEDIYLQMPAERVPAILKRLGMFVLRSKVKLSDASENLVRIGIAGPRAAERLTDAGIALPDSDCNQASTAGITLMRMPGEIDRFQALGDFDSIRVLWEALDGATRLASPDEWRLADIEAGMPNVYDPTAETFIPQMLNMVSIDGLSFTKGCYTGQEVVARMEYIGKLKRRMYIGEVTAEAAPQPGDELFSASSSSQQSTGWIVDAAPRGHGGHAVLAVVEIRAAEAADVRIGESGPAVKLSPPPYGFPAED